MNRLRQYLMPLDYYEVENEFKDHNINWDMIIEYISNIDTSKITYKSQYLKKIVFSEIDSGKYTIGKDEVKKETLNTLSLFERLRQLGFKQSTKGDIGVDAVITKVFENGCGLDELRSWIENAIQYIKDEKTTDKLYEILLKTKTLKKYINDTESLKEEISIDIACWEELEKDNNERSEYPFEVI